jgi:hypothetical protein
MSELGSHHDDLLAIEAEAQVEITAAELLQGAVGSQPEATEALATLELGYYEAELRSLRGAAGALDDAAG